MTHVHIHHVPGHYIGQVRQRGFRTWDTVTGKCITPENALVIAAKMMCRYHHRARVLWVGDRGSHSDPEVVMEARRR